MTYTIYRRRLSHTNNRRHNRLSILTWNSNHNDQFADTAEIASVRLLQIQPYHRWKDTAMHSLPLSIPDH